MSTQPLTLCSVIATFLLALTSPALAQPSDQARSSAADAEQKVRDLEEQRLKLFYEDDLALLDRLFADDLLIITQHPARMRTKKQFVEDFKSNKSKVSHVSQEIKQVRVYGDDTAVANGTMSIKQKDADGRDSSFDTLYTHVWIKRDGQWKLASVHRSPIELQGKPASESRR